MTDLDPRIIRQALRDVYRTDFFSFVWKVFDTLHPDLNEQFVPAWHVKAMCHELDNVRTGENKRLVINIPPRCLKSVTVSVAYVAFILGHSPSSKIIVASYSLDLARKHSEDCRRVLMSRWYQDAFPDTRLARTGNTLDEFKTTRGGGRKAVSTGSSVTGHGADYIIIDDLLNAADADSDVERNKAEAFIDSSLMSRFNNPSEARVVMIAQRLHELDPPGYLLSKGTYRHLNLRAIAEEEERIAIGQGRFHCRTNGEALFPERLDLDVLAQKRRESGPAVFNCQYQQNPIAPDGSPLRWEWFKTYDEVMHRNWYQLVVQSWDTAESADPKSDFSVCTTWGFRERAWYLLDVWRGQLDFPDLKLRVQKLADQWNADKVLIEDASSGRPLFQELFPENRRTYKKIRPEKDKEIRFSAACVPVREGLVHLPREAPWLPAFKRELQSFPRGTKMDQADSFSQFLIWSRGTGFWRSLPPDDPLREERRERHRNRPSRRSWRDDG